MLQFFPQELGDLVVEGDKNTMFGDSDEEYEILDAGYRAHGSLHEMELPMIIYNTNLEIDLPQIPYISPLWTYKLLISLSVLMIIFEIILFLA